MNEETAFFDPSHYLGCPSETCSSHVTPGSFSMVGLDLDQSFHGPLMAEHPPTAAATDLLSLLRLPAASFPAEAPSGMLRDLFQTVPQNYGMFYGAEEREMGVGDDVFRRDDGGMFEDGVFEFRKEGRGKGKGSFPTEKQRRAQINEKYDILKLLVPNPTKADRASVVSDTIDYINELKRTIEELTILVENKKNGQTKKRKSELTAAPADVDASPLMPDVDLPFNGSLRSSWLQRKSKDTFVDVRIVDDEVNVKVTRRKKPNCLLLASKAMDDLRLDLLHASGGHIGDCYVFMFNTKISEGASVYASAVAKKLLEAMDRPTRSSPIS